MLHATLKERSNQKEGAATTSPTPHRLPRSGNDGHSRSAFAMLAVERWIERKLGPDLG
jgi:hypothetical protein